MEDAGQHLYPLIQSWPVPSRSAEALLVRRDGADALYLNELRHRKDTALALRVPLDRVEMPAVMAVLGKQGVAEGPDYRGIEVLAVLHAVPDSAWFMVAKMNAEEAFAASRTQSAFVVALTLLMVAVMLVAAGVIRQTFEKARLQTRAEEVLREREERFRILFHSSRDALMTAAPPSWRFTSANQATLDLFGVGSAAEFIERGPGNISPKRQPDGRPSDEKSQEMVATAMREGKSFFEWTHQRMDGGPFSAEVLLTRMNVNGDAFLQATVRDIAERKRSEEALRRQTEELRAHNEVLTRLNRAAAGRELRVIELKQEINKLAARLGQPRPYALAFMDAAAAGIVGSTPKPAETPSSLEASQTSNHTERAQ